MFKVKTHIGNKLIIATDWITFPVYIEESEHGPYVRKSSALWIQSPEWNQIVRVALLYWNKLQSL